MDKNNMTAILLLSPPVGGGIAYGGKEGLS